MQPLLVEAQQKDITVRANIQSGQYFEQGAMQPLLIGPSKRTKP